MNPEEYCTKPSIEVWVISLKELSETQWLCQSAFLPFLQEDGVAIQNRHRQEHSPQKSILRCYLPELVGNQLLTEYSGREDGHTVTRQKSCTTQIILYLIQVLRNSYHIYMIIYIYSIYIFDMNMRSGSRALLHVAKSEKNGVLKILQILDVRVCKNMKN